MKFRIEPGNVITFSVGLLFVAGAIYVYLSSTAYIARAGEANAVVVDIVSEGGRKARMHPVVRFTAENGREITAHLQQHHNVQRGDTVRVVYDTADPQIAEIDTVERAKHRRTLISVLAALIGLLVCTLGVALDANTLEWRLRKRSG